MPKIAVYTTSLNHTVGTGKWEGGNRISSNAIDMAAAGYVQCGAVRSVPEWESKNVENWSVLQGMAKTWWLS